MSTEITVTDYQTGDSLRTATAADLAAAADCDRDTGVFACPVTGRSVYLEGAPFDGIAYTLVDGSSGQG